MAQSLTSPVYSTLIVNGREVEEGWLPAGTRLDGRSLQAARRLLAQFDSECDPRITLVVENEGGRSSEQAPLSAWRAGGVRFEADDVATRRAVACPTCAADVGTPCPGTRDHSARYTAAGQAPPVSGTTGADRHRQGRGEGLLLTDEALAGDLARALTLTLRGRTLSYPEEASTPERRAALLFSETRALADRFAAPAER